MFNSNMIYENAFKIQIRKMKLANIDIQDLYEISHFNLIRLNLAKYAHIKGYPKVLEIPEWADEVTFKESNNLDFNKLDTIEIVNLPDRMEIDKDTYTCLSNFNGVKTIGINTRQIRYYRGLNEYEFKARIPGDNNMLVNDSIEKVINRIDKHYDNGVKRFIAYETASKFEDISDIMISLLLYPLEQKLINLNDIKDILTDKVFDILTDYSKILDESIINKARFIKNDYTLLRVFSVRRNIETKYKVEDNSDLYFLLRYNEKALNINLDQSFKPKLTISKNVLNGFYGDGNLGYFNYTIKGSVSPTVALEIIRLTQDYKFDRYNKSPRIMFLDFFSQNWLDNANAKNIWCYPDGTIYKEGYSDRYSIENIIFEACYLAEEFPTLSLMVSISRVDTDRYFDDEVSLKVIINNNSVIATDADQDDITNIDNKSEYINMINNLIAHNKPILTKSQLDIINNLNDLDNKNNDLIDKMQKIKVLVSEFDLSLQMYLSVWLKEQIGISLRLNNRRNSTFETNFMILRYLFNFNEDKLRRFGEEFY